MDLLPNLSIAEVLRHYAQQLESGAIPASSSIPLFPTTQTPASRTGSRTITNAIAPYSSLRGALGPDHDDTAAVTETAAPLEKHPLPGGEEHLTGLDTAVAPWLDLGDDESVIAAWVHGLAYARRVYGPQF
ncbi:hypothetical protein C8J56DRAFT_1045008 [Mycena floridula]|nr:hypothetical protein C8J56DRAFT_1045008 [Mycena floridula]